MTFLYPSFLWALAALSIPVIIHLFNFRRTTRVYFSNNRFLKQVKEVTSAKRRLKHYLILFSRLLFLLFLVLAFAQPVIPAKEQLGAERSIVFYIDNSQSMSAQIADKTRGLEAALRFAQNIVGLFPADTRYKIVTNDFAPFSNSYKAKPEALDILAQIRLSPVSRSVQEIRDRLRQDSRSSTDVFWISDLQKSTAGTIPSSWDSTMRWHLVPILYQKTENVFVDTAYLQNPFAARGEKNVLNVKMRNDGSAPAEQLNLKFSINGIQAGTALVDIPAKGSAETTFDLTTGLGGLNKGVVSFNDFPVSFDNEFFLALNFVDKVNVLEVKDVKTSTPVEKVFGNTQIFNFKSYSVGNFNYSLLNQAELVVVNGLNRIDQSLNLSLQNYLSQGGAILLIPGDAPEISSYQQFTRIGSLAFSPANKELAELNRPDFENPFFENVFEERTLSLAMPRAVKFMEWGGDRSAILRFKDDRPFLTRLDRNGKLYLLASPLEHAYTDFYNHALFVPVMYRIAASGKKTESKLYSTLAENSIRIRFDSALNDEPIKLVGEAEVLPSQRKVNNDVILEIPKFSINQGFYNVVASKDTLNLIAFNLDKAESLLDQYNANEMKNQMGNGSNISIFEAESTEAFTEQIKARYLGKALWKYAIIVSLVFLLAEVLLIRFLK
ncbi:BatA domain-containing protein [Chryseosolibacter indicus]|uniref:BatA domain-containing protein n=1 Tax=Chryseosolibacter indicus TaxID=2782351 RepID=A0ABS5VP12_9BACT|nr:BatA domain-containing protein [Chryseosolibacter indicus]MBT1703185.1 BatA domain-containing protein [Chryseosolibacter indicus]